MVTYSQDLREKEGQTLDMINYIGHMRITNNYLLSLRTAQNYVVQYNFI